MDAEPYDPAGVLIHDDQDQAWYQNPKNTQFSPNSVIRHGQERQHAFHCCLLN
jgi:hypothetical protein